MALTATQQTVQDAYQKIFGRDANFDALGGATYWSDQIDNNSLDQAGLESYLTNSAEGQTAVTNPDTGKITTHLGGVDPNKSIADTWVEGGTWADHFKPGGSFDKDLTGTIWEGMAGAGTATSPTTKNVAGLLNSTYNANNPNATFQSPYYQNDPITADTVIPGDQNNSTFGSTTATTSNPAAEGWWSQFADADAFKEFLQGDADTTSSTDAGMGDFMKFMMLMSVMGGGRGFGGGGGYGGSQFGYGGMNPGGVQAAYDPMANLQSMGTWFKDNFGSGGGATTSGINTGTTTGTT